MNYVTKFAVVLTFAAVAAPAFAGKTTDVLNAINPLTIKESFDKKEYGYTAAKAGVVATGVAAVGTGLWALNKYVPAFNKYVTQNAKAVAKGYVARLRNVDVPTWGLTAAVLALGAGYWKYRCQKNALALANANSRDAFFAELAGLETAKNDARIKAAEKAVTDAEDLLAKDDKKDVKATEALTKDVADRKAALVAAQATHANAAARLISENPAAKAADILDIKNRLVAAIERADAIAAYNK